MISRSRLRVLLVSDYSGRNRPAVESEPLEQCPGRVFPGSAAVRESLCRLAAAVVWSEPIAAWSALAPQEWEWH